MKVLLTGATGYIGKRLLPVLIEAGHEIVCVVRDVNRFHLPGLDPQKVQVIEADLLDKNSLDKIPKDIDGAYYLVHSMSSTSDYESQESESAINFRNAINDTQAKHVVYLGGIINESNLSDHLSSRKNVELELGKGQYHFTALRAAIIIGSGSASFEIIRDLVEKLPVMVTPKWLNTKCQPIGVTDVISFLSQTLFNHNTYDKNYDIGGPDILTYKEMLLTFADVRNLKRKIFIVPVMTPRLSSYWLYFVTSTSYRLAVALVDSMKIEVICRNDDLNQMLKIQTLSYRQMLAKAFSKIESNTIVSSWIDAYASSGIGSSISDNIQVPFHGCFIDKRKQTFNNRDECINKIWSIGGKNGWYYGNCLWRLRGFMDKMVGGVGLRRGRTNKNSLRSGDALDFWRVLYANKQEGRLILFAEMKLPGEAWLEFNIKDNILIQTATFRPRGIAGRLYWYSVYPFHGLIFNGLIKKLV
ncbi:MAG TPA: SDR family oxidoreductase [Cyclobacteriaceae bacterium]|nr:SDR family oxidoreductase [Cyclobacteriaceae bacterium]